MKKTLLILSLCWYSFLLPAWGQHLILDLYDCNPDIITSKDALHSYAVGIVDHIDMKVYGEPQIVWFGSGQCEGFTLVQLIETSNICAHFTNDGNRAFIDIFSCKWFDVYDAIAFTVVHFQAKIRKFRVIIRD